MEKENTLNTGIYSKSMEEFFIQRRIHLIDDHVSRHHRDLGIQRLYDEYRAG